MGPSASAEVASNRMQVLIGRLDAWQQRHRRTSFIVGVGVRYREDRGPDSGALLSYYGFVSLFPLLAVTVTLLGIVLQGDPELRDDILDSVFAQIPVVGTQLQQDATGLATSGWVLAVGLVVSIWSGLAVVRHAGEACRFQWGAPTFPRPAFLPTLARSVAALVVIGVGVVASSAATGAATTVAGLPLGGRVLGHLAAAALDVAMLLLAFRILIRPRVGWEALWAGSIVGGAGLWVLELVGATYISHVVVGASDVYGTFAIVFGLLVWLGLLARIVLLANEVNVVRAEQLWPRAISGATPTEADLRAADLTRRRDASLGAGDAP